MDPWADSTTTWAPEEKAPASPRPLATEPNAYVEGPVDPWAEPSSSSTIPAFSSQRRQSNSSQDHPREERSGSVGDFDPWGGNTAPIAPLSTTFRRNISEEHVEDDSKERSTSPLQWSQQNTEAFVHGRNSRDEDEKQDSETEHNKVELEPAIGDDDDPWGSGAAARRIKAQQEAEDAAQRMEILRLQEEAKGSEVDEQGNVTAFKPVDLDAVKSVEKDKESSASEVPTASGWRSMFSRAAAKSAKDTPKIETDVTGKNSEGKESPRSSTSTAAPRLWQAPTILGAHARSTSTSSRTGSMKEPSIPTSSSSKGPGWEVTTKKQQSGGGGGLIQSLFGSTTGNENESTTITATRKEETTSGLNRFGRGLQPPPVVSAVDDENDSFETEETGIEWEAGEVFDPKVKQPDLLADDTEEKPAESTVGKLLERWRNKNGQEGKQEDMTKADLSWLEEVGSNSQASQGRTTGVAGAASETDPDWLVFLNQQPAVERSSSNVSQKTNDRYRISSTSRGTSSTKIPPLAPPPTSASQRANSPFSFRGPGQGLASTASASRLASHTIAKPSSSLDAFGEFENASADVTASPNLEEAYRDDVADNNAALLKSRPAAAEKRSNSFLKSFQSRSQGSRYDYDEDEVESHDDNWSAFRDNPNDAPYLNGPYEDRQRNLAASPPAGTSQSSVSRLKDNGVSNTSSTSLASKTSSGVLPPPPPAPSSRPLSWDRNAPLLPPPGRPLSTGIIKQSPQPAPPATLQPSKPKTLSQGKTLTNDDLSFFENL